MPSFENYAFPYAAVVLTGGSSGIGKSFIKHIEKVAPEVPICNLSRRVPEGFSVELKRRGLEVDLSDSASREMAISEALGFLDEVPKSGPILLINNAGLGSYGEFVESESRAQREIIEVNINAVMDLTAGLLPILIQRGGTVMNVASITAFQPTPFIATYGATKAFLLHWGYSLRYELRKTVVKVMTVCPGSTETPFHDRAGMNVSGPTAKFAQTPDQVAAEALVALAKGKAHVVTGWSNKLLCFLATHLPRRMATLLSGRILAHLRR